MHKKNVNIKNLNAVLDIFTAHDNVSLTLFIKKLLENTHKGEKYDKFKINSL